MGQAYSAVAECDRPRHEVYVLTDLARSSWNPDQPAEGLDQVEKAKTTPGGKIATFVAPAGMPEEHVRRRDRRGRTGLERRDPGRAGRDPGPGPRARAQAANRVVEFYLDGVKKDRSPSSSPPAARSRSASRPRPGSRRANHPPRRAQAQRHPRPAGVRRQAVLHLQGPAGAQGAARSPTRRSTPSSSPRPSTPIRRRRAPAVPGRTVKPAEFVAQLPRHAQGLCRGLPAQRRDSSTKTPGACSTATSTRAAAWSSAWATAASAENYNGPTASQLLPAQLRRSRSPPRRTAPSARSPT